MRKSKVANTLLATWTARKRLKGRPWYTAQSTTLKNLHGILPKIVETDGNLELWVHYTYDPKQWLQLIQGELKPEDFNFIANQHDQHPPPGYQSTPSTPLSNTLPSFSQ